MDNLTFEISGYKAVFKPYLNFGQKRQLEKMMAASMRVNPETNKADTTISGAIIYETQDSVLQSLIVSLTTPEGKFFEGQAAYDAIQNFLPEQEEVGKAIYARVDEITKDKVLPSDKKKLNN